MKITPIKIAAAALVLTSISLASCASSGYGCDYGATESDNLNKIESEICLKDKAVENLVAIDYRKISKS